MSETKQKNGLELLREPFPAHQISKLPKPTKAQTDEVRNNFKAGTRCAICGAWHHPKVVHLDYVGHAALTDRLLDCDPAWNWEPVAVTDKGTPAIDENGGMWIRLTVCGVTRLGYGHPDGKKGGDAVKELIGDALRNAAMRFGAALDLWHKGDLHGHGDDDMAAHGETNDPRAEFEADVRQALKDISRETTLSGLGAFWADFAKRMKSVAADPRVIAAKDKRKDDLKAADKIDNPPADDLGGDEIPY